MASPLVRTNVDGMERHGLLEEVGGTPLVRVANLLTRDDVTVWAKLESFNPGGSAKDRTASAIVDAAVSEGVLKPGSTIVESSSGNFGVALARLALLNGWTFHCITDPRANRTTLAHMRALGAVVHGVTEPDPETGDWLAARLTRVRELLDEIPDAVTLDQYSHPAALKAHSEGTMREVTEALGHAPDLLFVAMSTTGTVGGCLRQLRGMGADTHVVGVDAEGSVLFGGTRGPRHLGGFGAGIIPALSAGSEPDEVARIPDVDSVVGCRVLAHREGILAGASGGAVVAALLERADRLPSGAEVVLVLHDGGVPYLDTVYDDEWVQSTLGVGPEELARRVERTR